jgi:hypothetical protein
MTVTTCRVCQRVIYQTDADDAGRCCCCVELPIPVVETPPHAIRWQQFGTDLCPDVLGWFHHEKALLPLLKQERPLICVEIGSFRGASAIPQALTMAEWGGRLTCIDPWRAFPGSYESMQENVARYGAVNCELWQMTSLEAAEQWAGEKREPPEWVYVDGDHEEVSVAADLAAWWDLLAPGGIILGDDYGNPDWPGVTAAWNAFARDKRLNTTGGPDGWGLVWIRKEPAQHGQQARPVGILDGIEVAA